MTFHNLLPLDPFGPSATLRTGNAQDKRQIQRLGGGFGNPPRALVIC